MIGHKKMAMDHFKASIKILSLSLIWILLQPVMAFAHPHVFVEANLEVVRDDNGMAVEIRQVWRFDEIYSSSILLDFDNNGDGKFDAAELKMISDIVKPNLAENNFYTEIRHGNEIINFFDPEPFIVDFKDNQLIMILAMKIEKPQKIEEKDFRIAVADPTYYVALDLIGNDAITMSGNSKACQWDIERPDFDKLLSENPEIANDDYGGATTSGLAADVFLTWVHFSCKAEG